MISKFYEGDDLVHEGQALSRRHKVGDPVRFNYIDYIVTKASFGSEIEVYHVGRAEICTKCGGVKNSDDQMTGCRPSFCR